MVLVETKKNLFKFAVKQAKLIFWTQGVGIESLGLEFSAIPSHYPRTTAGSST